MLPPGLALANRYEVLSVLSRSGRSVFYTARDRMTGGLCTVKVLELFDETAYKRFQREIQIVRELEHPGICTLLDCGLHDNTLPFVVMEHVKGQDMESYLKEAGPQPPEWTIPVVLQLCDALAYAHKAEVVHRNVKASAVILSDDIRKPKVKLLDFGYVRPLQTDSENPLTEAGVTVGTLLYLSPEQTRGTDLDARADIFALGCLMYRSLTGKNPYQASSLAELVMKHAEKPQKISKANPLMKISPEIENTVFQCLERDPAKRFQSMTELKAALTGGTPARSQGASLPKILVPALVVGAVVIVVAVALILHK